MLRPAPLLNRRYVTTAAFRLTTERIFSRAAPMRPRFRFERSLTGKHEGPGCATTGSSPKVRGVLAGPLKRSFKGKKTMPQYEEGGLGTKPPYSPTVENQCLGRERASRNIANVSSWAGLHRSTFLQGPFLAAQVFGCSGVAEGDAEHDDDVVSQVPRRLRFAPSPLHGRSTRRSQGPRPNECCARPRGDACTMEA